MNLIVVFGLEELAAAFFFPEYLPANSPASQLSKESSAISFSLQEVMSANEYLTFYF